MHRTEVVFPRKGNNYFGTVRFVFRLMFRWLLFCVFADPNVGICSGRGSREITYNTGLTTLLNYGQVLAPNVVNIVFAHEFGHNLGSPVSFIKSIFWCNKEIDDKKCEQDSYDLIFCWNYQKYTENIIIMLALTEYAL